MTSMEDKPVKAGRPKIADSAILYNLYNIVDRVENTIKESVVNVYADRYRVNIWKGTDNPFLPKAGTIAASYFISVDASGKIKILNS